MSQSEIFAAHRLLNLQSFDFVLRIAISENAKIDFSVEKHFYSNSFSIASTGVIFLKPMLQKKRLYFLRNNKLENYQFCSMRWKPDNPSLIKVFHNGLLPIFKLLFLFNFWLDFFLQVVNPNLKPSAGVGFFIIRTVDIFPCSGILLERSF